MILAVSPSCLASISCGFSSVSQATIFQWKKKFAGMTVNEAKRLRELEAENARLKKLVADQALNIEVLKEVNSKKW